MITRHFLTIPSTDSDAGGRPPRRVHYRRCGSGPVLLMVHQSPRSSIEYERLMEQWGAHFTCIAPDTPGFGQSDALPPKADGSAPEIAEFADAVIEFLSALGVGRCAAYGFHSGGIILVTALKRHPGRFSCLAVGGYAIWTPAEIKLFGESYLPPFEPSGYGEHLTWLWNRMLEQSWYFPWFDVRDVARLPGAHADVARVNAAVLEMLDSGAAYQAGYGAVLRASREIPPAGTATPPVLITAYDGDPLQTHIDRIGAMPAAWSAHKVITSAQHEADSLGFLREHAAYPCPPLAEDADEGFVAVSGGLVHWRGAHGAARLVLHAPGGELAAPGADEIAIDVPGHGLSAPQPDIAAAIEAARIALGARSVIWPATPAGDPAQLYPDLTPDRFGAHLTRAWSAVRAAVLFDPWYAAGKDAAKAIDPAALEPATLALRTRALLRAGPAARAYHELLAQKDYA